MGSDEEGLSLYIHVPFCVKKCYYCDFNSYPLELYLIPQYLYALEAEIEDKASLLESIGKERTINTIYFGGGTPTILNPTDLIRLLELCRKSFKVSEEPEITIEANPGTLNREKLQALIEAGINRLSLGAQSFDDRLLARIGRIHNSTEIIENYLLAREVGFENISMDLIFGLPGETLETWSETLYKATELKPDHISTYNLVIEEGTRLYEEKKKGLLEPISQELDLAMYTKALEIIENAGYFQYEISNFSKPGKECHHNLVYWRNQEYLGFGPGAHSNFQGQRFSNRLGISEYISGVREGSYVAYRESIERAVSIWETIFLGLRLTEEGVNLLSFQKRFNVDLREVYSQEISELEKLGLLRVGTGCIVLTKLGLPLANQVFLKFAPEED